MRRRRLTWAGVIGLVVIVGIIVTGCAGPEGAQGPAGPAGDIAEVTCSDCHDDTTLVLSKQVQVKESTHVAGGTYVRGTSASCAGCHASEGFTAMIAAGLTPNTVEEGVTNPSPANCRTCHQIHETYTAADWALSTTAPVTLAVSGETLDMGDGNLCASCHQPRRPAPEVGGGDVEITSTHWGPHYGTQSTMLLGIGGYGASDSPGAHYNYVSDGCPVCHMAEDSHTFEADLAGCQSCHAELDTLDYNEVQTEVQALIDELEELLEAEGLLHDGHPVVGTATEAQAGALWNYRFVTPDGSLGVHNSAYTKALLRAAIIALK